MTTESISTRDSWGTFEGIDVEGRLAGLKTLFVAFGELPDNVTDYPHVWFQPQWQRTHGYDAIFPLLDHCIVTLEVNLEMIADIPPDLRQLCHIVLAIPVSSIIRHMKLTDTIRLDIEDRHVACAMVGTFIETHPEQYIQDKPITLRDGFIPIGGAL